jgi:hypothetical protein
MARKTGQIIRRGPQMWMVRIYVGRDPETRKRTYIGKSINGGLRAIRVPPLDAQLYLRHPVPAPEDRAKTHALL